MRTIDALELFLVSRVTRNCATDTLKWYRLALDKYAEMYPELPSEVEDIEKFLASRPGKDERRHGYFRALKALYRFLNKRYKIPNPILRMDAPHRRRKMPRPLSLENYIKLMNYSHSPDTAAFLQFISDTGCRVGELCNLHPDDFEQGPEGRAVRLDGKTGQRLVPVSEQVYRDILPWIPVNYKVAWMTRRLSTAFKTAGVRGTAHNLRHTFCSLWRGSETALQQITGHCDANTLGIYRRLRLHEVSKQHKQYTLLNYLNSGYTGVKVSDKN